MRAFARVAAFAFSLLFATGLVAQSTSLNGTVSDPSHAVVPNASVSLVSVGTGQTREAKSDAQGRYSFSQLTPGKYTLTVKAQGFAEEIVSNVELQVDQPATIPVTLKVGATSTTVTVEAGAIQLNTTDASLGNVINTEQITELPTYARNVVALLANQPGVTIFGSAGQGANGTNNLDYRSGSVNGGKSDQGTVTLDGVNVDDQNARAAFTSVLRVTPDSVEEFRSTTTNEDSSGGRGSGANVSMVTKAGTNSLHGTVYEYRRGTETAANSFFNNRSGVGRPALLTNVFGMSLGGPIKKNKLFFFMNYEGRRDRSAGTAERTVPMPSMQMGILNYQTTAGGPIQTVGAAGLQQLDTAGLGIDAAALKALNALPAGNDSNFGDKLNTMGYRFNAPEDSDQNTYIMKLDYKLDSAGNHALFVRGNLQNDSGVGPTGLPQFPGQPGSSITLANNKGLAAGSTDVLSSNLVNTFRYGLTRVGNQTTGVLSSNYEWFRSISTPSATTTGTTRIIPVHNFSEDLAWTKGAHTMRFGATALLISNQSASLSNSYSSASSNPSWLTGSGNALVGSLGVTSGDKTNFEYAASALLGVEAQGTGAYNYLVNGTVIPPGSPVVRNFVNHEGEIYAQDSWKFRRNLTITAGIRFALQPTVYEANGQQASTNIPIATWLGERASLAQQGLSEDGVTPITFIPANGPGGRGLYPAHYNWQPRLGIAYSPTAASGLSKFLFGGAGKTSIRLGGGFYYDMMGQPLAQTFSSTQFGLSSNLSNPANTLALAQAPRFTTFNTVPSVLVPATPPGGLPVTYPSSGSGSFAITNSIDDQLKAPYTMNVDFSIGRDFGHGWFVQGSYVGRFSRHSLIQRDLAMPTDLVDPKSGQDYFSAMTQLAQEVDFQGVTIANLQPIPFFQDMWSTAAAGGYTATQIWALDYHGDPTKGIAANSNQGDFTNTLNDADNAANCTKTTTFTSKGGINSMGCGIYGPWMIFNPQFSSLSANSSIGIGEYHAMQWTIRKTMRGLVMDLNYTWSKSIDDASTTEGGSFNGFVINTWNPSQMRGVSAYDTTQQINASVIYPLPFGRGQRFLGSANKIVDAFIGGWQVSVLYRQTSGLPFTVSNGQRWPTNWNVDANATLTGALPPIVSTGNGNLAGGGPNLWANSAAAFAAFSETMPGQSGQRDMLRGNGLFNIDTGVSKSFQMPWSEKQSLQFRWESFNLTNTVRFDPASASLSTISSSNFGALGATLGNPRVMQFALRYKF
jgi:hypothetical protein